MLIARYYLYNYSKSKQLCKSKLLYIFLNKIPIRNLRGLLKLTVYTNMQSVKSFLIYPAVRRTLIRRITVNSAQVNPAENAESAKPYDEIPGPTTLPIIGQMHHFLPGQEFSDITKIMENMYKFYGPIAKLNGIFGRVDNIFLYDPEQCATVLRSENWHPYRTGFGSLEYYRKDHKQSKGQAPKWTGLITDHGETWKKFRSTVNPVMLHPKTIKLYASVLEEVSDDMIERMRSLLDEKNMIKSKFDAEMNLWALESIGVVALGGRLNCFNPNLAEDSPERKLIQCVHDLFEIATELDFKPNIWRYISTPKFKRGMKLYEEQEKLARFFVHRAIKDLNSKPKTDDEKGILEKLMEIDEEIAVIMASDLLFAGVDTASNTITATLYLLASNPEKQDKLREELQSGKERSYLKACLKESLRMMPVAGANVRRTTKEYKLLGYKVPIGVDVIFCHQVLSNMEKYFPRSKEYIPERWIEKESPIYYTSAPPFAYSPFGFGVRSCIGRRIAELEIETFLSKVIQNFKIEWFGEPLKMAPTSLNYMKPPYNFIFKEL